LMEELPQDARRCRKAELRARSSTRRDAAWMAGVASRNGNHSSLTSAWRCGGAVRIRYGLWRVVAPVLFESWALIRAEHAREANSRLRSAWRLDREPGTGESQHSCIYLKFVSVTS